MSNQDFAPSAKRAVEAVDGVKHKLRISPRGQVTTSVTGCPREMKVFLLLNGEPVVFCDIAHAHHCFLPAILGARIEYLREKYGPEANTGNYEAELKRLIEFLGDGDYYSKWCRNTEDPVEREEKKLLLTMILNWQNVKCESNALFRRMRRRFPLTFKICEDIKRKDHRNLSKSLQHYTAKAINRALLEAQARGIAAIPDVDAIVCQQRHGKVVSRLIGREVHALTNGVCCKVNGIRYAPVASHCDGVAGSSLSKLASAPSAPRMKTGSGEAPATTNLAASKVRLAQPLHEVDGEPRRIAGELVRLHRDGAIRSHKDASFYAHLLRDFDATYTGPVSNTDEDDQPGRYMPTKQQLVRVPSGLTMEERQRFLQRDVDDAIVFERTLHAGTERFKRLHDEHPMPEL